MTICIFKPPIGSDWKLSTITLKNNPQGSDYCFVYLTGYREGGTQKGMRAV